MNLQQPPSDIDYSESPLLTLLQRDPSQMSDAELDTHLNELNQLNASHHETKKAIANSPKKPKGLDPELLKSLLQ
jgi:hypothetical protein